MPELPETETIARDLDSALSGLTIVGVTVTRPDVLREVTSAVLERRLSNADISGVVRRAKLVVIEMATGDRIVVQPRFTGALLLDDGRLPPYERRYSTVELRLSDGRALHYRDIRRLGTVALMSAERFAEYSSRLGIEPLDDDFTVQRLSAILRASRQAVKRVLMDQRRLVGVGNIYANEALWRAGIDPSRPASSVSEAESIELHAALRDVLASAVRERGTSFRDYRDAAGEPGRFASLLEAYGRGGRPCRRCGRRMVATHAVDGRSTVFCYVCQR